MPKEDNSLQYDKNERLIREIIEFERGYFFEKRNVKTERRRKLRELIERHSRLMEGQEDDS